MIEQSMAALLLLAGMIANLMFTTATAEEEVRMLGQDAGTSLKITIVYDNTLYEPELTAGWGFSALIEYKGHTLLFDTGADGQALLNNMAALHINPLEIETVVLSHNHSDHTGGLNALLSTGVQPKVYLLPSFPASFKQPISQVTTVIETTPDQVITEGIFTTGEMGGSTPEQAIAIEIDQGVVILTGCAHPGIIAVIEHVKETSGKPVHLVLGGFHLKDAAPTEIAAIVQAFRRLGVEHVGPCHCTGEQAMAAFAEEYGDDFVQVGTGKIIEISAPVESPSG
jgi:7,8-dihydropterin-6-yl-methyl-4-(beta-D-ribofuranosyl)aminobenzene 5'-phosphate synthase